MPLTAHDILMDADLFRAAYPGWPSAARPDTAKGPPVQTAAQVRDRLAGLTVDDAIVASAILAEVSAGHEEAADRLAVMARLGDLDVADLEMLCRRYGVAFDDDIRY